jgi:hypothetical protein
MWTRTLHCHLCSPAINARMIVHAIIEDPSILPCVCFCRIVTFDTHARKRVYAHRACYTPRTQSTCISSFGTVRQPNTRNTLTANKRHALLTSSQTTHYHFAKFTAIEMRKSQVVILAKPLFQTCMCCVRHRMRSGRSPPSSAYARSLADHVRSLMQSCRGASSIWGGTAYRL